VTGGTGFLGRAIVERLLADSERVKALARSDESAGALSELGAEPVRGDVLDPEALTTAMRGCGLVYHAAGANAFCVRDPSPMFEVNVQGSENVIRAAARAEVKRVVYTSSAAVLGERKGTVGSEQSPHRGRFLSDYERSKFEAERAVLAAADETGVEVICLNPASVQGPGRATGSTQLLLDYLNGRLKAVVDSTLSLIDIADCTTRGDADRSRGARAAGPPVRRGAAGARPAALARDDVGDGGRGCRAGSAQAGADLPRAGANADPRSRL
jgi:dihydroflavonol-4-reductase